MLVQGKRRRVEMFCREDLVGWMVFNGLPPPDIYRQREYWVSALTALQKESTEENIIQLKVFWEQNRKGVKDLFLEEVESMLFPQDETMFTPPESPSPIPLSPRLEGRRRSLSSGSHGSRAHPYLVLHDGHIKDNARYNHGYRYGGETSPSRYYPPPPRDPEAVTMATSQPNSSYVASRAPSVSSQSNAFLLAQLSRPVQLSMPQPDKSLSQTLMSSPTTSLTTTTSQSNEGQSSSDEIDEMGHHIHSNAHTNSHSNSHSNSNAKVKVESVHENRTNLPGVATLFSTSEQESSFHASQTMRRLSESVAETLLSMSAGAQPIKEENQKSSSENSYHSMEITDDSSNPRQERHESTPDPPPEQAVPEVANHTTVDSEKQKVSQAHRLAIIDGALNALNSVPSLQNSTRLTEAVNRILHHDRWQILGALKGAPILTRELAREMFGVETLKESTITGRQYKPLDKNVLMLIRGYVMSIYGVFMHEDDFAVLWEKCVESVRQLCKALRGTSKENTPNKEKDLPLTDREIAIVERDLAMSERDIPLSESPPPPPPMDWHITKHEPSPPETPIEQTSQ
ncbi:unnamed protein product [Owenia fusiformis]|uniref:Uncharacterized protein n=1 Tax=Owenia fusiformis TaxID=6347 RepID=A0A8J1UJP6_OWEFU|nr:unnamed protein product [Owenia fusiformis]